MEKRPNSTMYIHLPDNWNGLLILADSRLPTDGPLDQTEGGIHVLELWKFARETLGDETYNCTARMVLWDSTTSKEQLKATRDVTRTSLLAKLADLKPKVVLVLQTLKRHKHSAFTGTACWQFIGGPGAITDTVGTAWESEGVTYIPILNPRMYDAVVLVYIARWMRAAVALLGGRAAILKCPEIYTEPNLEAIRLLNRYLELPAVAFDLESLPGKDILTAVNLSDGVSAVSLPWQAYDVYPGGYQPALETYELGLAGKRLIEEILASPSITKIGHNSIGFDGLELARKGIALGGPQEDTILMHAATHNQYRHGLQLACATELLVPPWKSLHKPVAKKDSSWEFWAADPTGLRVYGAQDAFYTFKLYEILKEKLG